VDVVYAPGSARNVSQMYNMIYNKYTKPHLDCVADSRDPTPRDLGENIMVESRNAQRNGVIVC
jgi:hypothetical protein